MQYAPCIFYSLSHFLFVVDLVSEILLLFLPHIFSRSSPYICILILPVLLFGCRFEQNYQRFLIFLIFINREIQITYILLSTSSSPPPPLDPTKSAEVAENSDAVGVVVPSARNFIRKDDDPDRHAMSQLQSL